MKRIGVFVPGKVLISGEHSVVYGERALVAGIDKGARVVLEEDLSLSKPEILAKHDGMGLVKKAVKVAGGGALPLRIRIESDLPVGSGLGSSAALGAATIKAVKTYLGETITQQAWFDLTMEVERVAHGNPSGVDPAGVIYGGLVRFVKGKEITPLKTKKVISFLLVQTGKPKESTKEMVVEVVGNQMREKEKMTNTIIKNIGKVTRKLETAMRAGGEIRELINENGRLLEQLGVVGTKAKILADELRKMGAGVKIVGAGGIRKGSGMMLVYDSNLDLERSYLKQHNWNYMEVTIGQ